MEQLFHTVSAESKFSQLYAESLAQKKWLDEQSQKKRLRFNPAGSPTKSTDEKKEAEAYKKKIRMRLLANALQRHVEKYS